MDRAPGYESDGYRFESYQVNFCFSDAGWTGQFKSPDSLFGERQGRAGTRYSPIMGNIRTKEGFKIFKISRKEADTLRLKGYEDFVKVSSGTHKSRSKRYWVVEDRKVIRFLDNCRNNIIVR